jgi:obg-like ATPase 1
MKDYIRQKNKYLPQIAKWVKEHGGQGTDIIPFSVEFEEKVHSLREDKEKLDEFLKEAKVMSRLPKIVTEGLLSLLNG